MVFPRGGSSRDGGIRLSLDARDRILVLYLKMKSNLIAAKVKSSTPSPTSSPKIRELVCELCRNFYQLGWASGTGGGISIKEGGLIYMAPSGVQKERLNPEEIFVLDTDGNIVEEPGHGMKLSQCAPLFMHAYKLRNAGAVLHSHSVNAA